MPGGFCTTKPTMKSPEVMVRCGTLTVMNVSSAVMLAGTRSVVLLSVTVDEPLEFVPEMIVNGAPRWSPSSRVLKKSCTLLMVAGYEGGVRRFTKYAVAVPSGNRSEEYTSELQ